MIDYFFPKAGSLENVTFLMCLEQNVTTKTTAVTMESFYGFGKSGVCIGGQNLSWVCRSILPSLGPPQLPYGVKFNFLQP